MILSRRPSHVPVALPQDGSGPGTVIGWFRSDRTRAVSGDGLVAENPLLPGWARVRWDSNGSSNSYEIGTRGLHTLHFASAAPGPVRSLSASSPVSTGQGQGLRLTWRPPSDPGTPPLDSYVVSRDGVELALLPADVTAYTDESAAGGCSYCYSVCARSGGDDGPWSEARDVYVPRPEDRLTLIKLVVTGAGLLRFACGVQPQPRHKQQLQLRRRGSSEPQQQGGLVWLDGGAVAEEQWVHVAVTMEGAQVRWTASQPGSSSMGHMERGRYGQRDR